MALIVSEDFEGLSNSVTLTSSNTAFDEFTMATDRTATATTTAPIDGSVSGVITHGGTSGNARIGWTTSTLSGSTFRVVAKFSLSAISSEEDLCFFQSGATRLCTAMVIANGTLRCYPTANSPVATSAGFITTDTPFRLELFYDATTGTIELRAWQDADDTGEPDAILTPTPNGETGDPTRIAPTWFSGSTAGTIRLDSVELHDDYWPDGSVLIEPPPADATADMPSGGFVAAAVTVTPPAADATADAPAATVTAAATATITVVPADATADAVAATITGGTSVSVSVPPADATADAVAATVTTETAVELRAIRVAFTGVGFLPRPLTGPRVRRGVSGAAMNSPTLDGAGIRPRPLRGARKVEIHTSGPGTAREIAGPAT